MSFHVGYDIKEEVHALITKHVTAQCMETFYDAVLIQQPDTNMPHLAGVNLWLSTGSFSWRQLAWGFYRCHVSEAVIEVKHKFIEGRKVFDNVLDITIMFTNR